MSKWVRQQLESQFTDVHSQLLDLLSEIRDEARELLGTSELPGWETVIDDDLIALVASGRNDEARARVRHAIGLGAVS